jgi:hypothetical protein
MYIIARNFPLKNRNPHQVAKSPVEDIQLSKPVETGGLPAEGNSGSTIDKTEGNMTMKRILIATTLIAALISAPQV